MLSPVRFGTIVAFTPCKAGIRNDGMKVSIKTPAHGEKEHDEFIVTGGDADAVRLLAITMEDFDTPKKRQLGANADYPESVFEEHFQDVVKALIRLLYKDHPDSRPSTINKLIIQNIPVPDEAKGSPYRIKSYELKEQLELAAS